MHATFFWGDIIWIGFVNFVDVTITSYFLFQINHCPSGFLIIDESKNGHLLSFLTTDLVQESAKLLILFNDEVDITRVSGGSEIIAKFPQFIFLIGNQFFLVSLGHVAHLLYCKVQDTVQAYFSTCIQELLVGGLV